MEHRFIAFDKTPIFYRRIPAKDNLRAVIFLVHGMGEHGGRYLPLAQYLAELGIEG